MPFLIVHHYEADELSALVVLFTQLLIKLIVVAS